MYVVRYGGKAGRKIALSTPAAGDGSAIAEPTSVTSARPAWGRARVTMRDLTGR